MKTNTAFLILISLVITTSCKAQVTDLQNQTIESYSFNTDSLLSRIQKLSSDEFEGRRTGTKGAQKAKDFIIDNFKRLNIQPLNDDYQQQFSFEARGKSYNGINVLGTIKGSISPESYIVISAHYDHEGIKNNVIYNGADDDASGISALFAFAEYFQKNPPKHSVIIAAFDSEELGLQGSKYYVDNPLVPLTNIKLNINLDMISRNDKNELYVTGTAYNDVLKSIISGFKTMEGISLLMGHDGKDGLQNWTFSSDHGSFHAKKVPFLYFGVEDHKDYHQPTDDYENIHPTFYINAIETIISVFAKLDTSTF